MKGYENYRESGVLWLGRIPAHWEEKFLQQVCSVKKEKNTGNRENNVLSLSYGYVIRKRDVYSGLVASDFSTYQIVRKGDIILRFTDLQNDHNSLRTGLVQETGIITSAYVCITPTINNSYLHYLLHAYDVRKVFYGMGTGVRQSIGYKDIRHMLVPVPPIDEQEQIAHFLDWKISGIDRMISIRQKQITGFAELKKALITQTVTRGNWERVRLKRVVTVRSEKGTYRDKTDDKYIGLENIRGYSEKLIETDTEYDTSTQSRCRKGDLLFGKLRPYLAKVIIAPYDSFCTSELLVISSFAGDMRYLRYIMLSHDFISKVDSSTYGAKMPRANSTFILNISIPLPPTAEQIKISQYLDKKCSLIDRAISNLTQQINTLKELKTSLISEAVTGKIDVRHITIPVQEKIS